MQERSVAMTNLADLLVADAHRFSFIKLDVQGAELSVLRGFGARLRDAEVVLLELSLVAYNEGAPLLAAVADELGTMGFVLHDLVDENRYVDGSLLQCEAIFVRWDSTLRPSPPFWT